MSRYYSYVNTSIIIIKDYNGEEPLSRFLKVFFSKSKKYGSKDRKVITMLCYQYFRAAKAFKTLEYEEQVLIAHFLCCDQNTSILADLKPIWHENTNKSIEEKLRIISNNIGINTFFCYENYLSKGVDLDALSKSMLIQPKLFVRIRPEYEQKVLQKLNSAALQFEKLRNDTVSFENSTKIEELIEIGKEAIIQDLNSQNVGKFIAQYIPHVKKEALKVWDCCAASGGKSIMIFDQNKDIDLTVSDVRTSILQNLKERFALAGIVKYESFLADLTDQNGLLPYKKNFDVIIADVPCTGSGTWARTPEQHYYFKEEKISFFSGLQKKIIEKSTQYLAIGGYFVFITCSIFMEENEENAEFIQNKLKLKLVAMQLLEGYNMKADTMFVAIFKKE